MQQEEERMKLALFRWGVIAPVLCRKGTQEQLRELRQQILATEFEYPDGSVRRVAERTLRHWIERYRSDGFDGLYDVRRSDRGASRAIPEAVLEKAEGLRREELSRSVPKIISMLSKQGCEPGRLAKRTLGRQLVKRGATKERLKKGAGSYQRWEQLHANDLWQGDVSHGVWLRDPYNPAKAKKTKLIAFIDDATRVCIHAEFYFDEQLPSLIDCFGKALLKRGRPCRMLFDNGSIYRSTSLAAMAAELGIEIAFCRPRAPQGKGKIERFFRTTQEGFFKEAACAGIENLAELNVAFQNWLKNEYHEKEHSELSGLTPLQRWEQDRDRLSLVTVDELRTALMLRAKRRVHTNTALVSIDGRDYQCSTDLAGQEVEVRWNQAFTNTVDVWVSGAFVETAFEFQLKPHVVPRVAALDEEPSPGTPRASSKSYFQSLLTEDGQSDIAVFKADELLSLPEFLSLFTTICHEADDVESKSLTRFFSAHAPMYKSIVSSALTRAVAVKGPDLHLRYYLEQLKQALRRR